MNRSRKILIGVVLALTILLSGLLVNSYNREPLGYVAVYDVVAMWMLALLALMVGMVLLIFRRTRFSGWVVAFAAFLVPVVFFGGVKASEAAGLNRWLNAPLVHFGPDVPSGLVVYYKTGISEAEISNFQEAQLYQARPDSSGKEFRPGITSFLALLPEQAHGHYAFALDLDSEMRPEQRASLISSLSSSPLVFKVYSDVAPNSIPDPAPATGSVAAKSPK
jgi:hypothetical protein